METSSIISIKDLRDKIREKQDSNDMSKFNNIIYGPENEYTGKSIYQGIDAILIDISYLLKSHNIFIQVSTLNERYVIRDNMTSILQNFESPQTIAQFLDSLKTELRKFNIRNNKDRWELFQGINKELLEQKQQFKEALLFINEIKEEATSSNTTLTEKLEAITNKFEELEEKIEELEEIKTEIVSSSEELKSVNIAIGKVKEQAEENLEGIKESVIEVKGNEKIIDSFAKKVQERDAKIIELQQQTEDNKIKLTEYEVERVKILEQANQLIESAKTALNYKTAEGISASFQTQHTDAKNIHNTGWWVLGASVFIVIAILLGIWIALDSTDKLHLIIGRIALIPLPIVAAIFCANQYVKQKNIIEDYAYKMVLAKSIVGFSEQLKKEPSEDKGEYVHYLKVALEEIHKDPLRKRYADKTQNKSESFSIKEVVEMAERILKIGKS
jgi:hypothetical protein